MARRLTHLIGLLMLIALLGSPAARAQDDGGHAALVIRYPDGNVQTTCVSFNESSITGERLLELAQLTVTSDYSSGMGSAVCSINGIGCEYPIEDCFCQCQGLQCEYWAYYHWVDGAWQYSSVGVSGYRVTDGALEGLSWGPGDFASGIEPPQIAFEDVCRPSTATPTPTSTAAPPTSSPTPTATATAVSTAISVSLPQIHLTADVTTLDPGACAVLKWVTWDATQVTLNGSPVMAQDRQEVCPTVSQRYLLVAANVAGQTQQDVTVFVSVPTVAPTPTHMSARLEVVPTIASTPTLLPVRTEAASAVSSATATGAQPAEASAPRSGVVAPTAQPLPSPIPPPTSAKGSRLNLMSVAQAQTLPTPSPDTAQGLIPTAVLLPTVVPAPVSKEGPPPKIDAGPMPTPMLMAFAGARDPSVTASGAERLSSVAEQDGVAAAFTPPDRRFSLTLLPGYAVFLLMAACLLGAGVVVARRREILLGSD